MRFVRCTLVLCVTFQMLNKAAPVYHDDSSDFDTKDEMSMVNHFLTNPDIQSFERMMLRDMAEDEPEFFNDKEKSIRDALARSTLDTRSQRTLSEVLPILQTLSEQQRLVLAAIISTRTNPKFGKSLDFQQIEEMFGERRNSILPIVVDVANIVEKNMLKKSTENKFHDEQIELHLVNDDDEPTGNESHLQPEFHRSRRSSKYEDDRPSYHERKLNMTNFRGTPESNDQHAIESETRIHVSLPNSNTSSAVTLEEVENLAFKDLNGTGPTSIVSNNSTNIENLPEPEMLTGQYRVRPRPISELFDKIYLYVDDYPTNQIMGSIRRHRYAMSALLADNPNDWQTRMQEMENKKRRGDEENNVPTSGMCPSLVRYAQPQRARSASGEWKYIVNTGQHTQTLRLEKCTDPEQSCTYLTDNFSSRCAQIYNYHRLLSWDNKRGLHIDIFKVPTCCSCQIDGYRETFPPISSHAADDQEILGTRFTASDALYSLANNDYNDNEGDADESPSEPNGSVFRPIIRKKQRFEKPKKNKRPSNSLLDTFLTPPSPTYEPDVQFKRKQSSILIANRASDASHQTPVLIGSDDAPDTEHPSKNEFSPISVPIKNTQLPRPSSSKVLIKRVNYNYHPIIDFFFRDRIVKAAKAKENRAGHTMVS